MLTATRSEGMSPARPDWTAISDAFARTSASKWRALVTTSDAVEASRPCDEDRVLRRNSMPEPVEAESSMVVEQPGMRSLGAGVRSHLFQAAITDTSLGRSR